MLTRKVLLRISVAVGIVAILPWNSARAADPARPNILWLSAEDIGPHLGCYGDPNAITPSLDSLAARGTRYARAYTVAPVCAPNRSSIITGMYAHSLGTQHMRSGGEGTKRSIEPTLPESILTLPELLGASGYYCTNNSKEDYNFPPPPRMWNGSGKNAHWRNRANPDQPFFAVFNFQGSHEGAVRGTKTAHAANIARLTPDQRQDPDKITPPPFHPDTPVVRENWAAYLENITALDYWVQDFLDQLAEDGLAENTIVIFWSDHGAGLPRSKRWLYQSGTHVPLIAYIPEACRAPGQGTPGTVVNDLISSVDLAPTTLALAGLPIPGNMQGQPFLGASPAPPRDFVFGGRDRMDERYDLIRMVRSNRYTYIRNYMPFKPYNQFINTAEKSPVKEELLRLANEGKLTPGTEWVARKTKPVEEFYDLSVDPHEINNLADDPARAEELKRHREAHEQWTREFGDVGLIPEPELVVLAKEFGSRHEILDGITKTDPEFMARLRETAVKAGVPGEADAQFLSDALDDSSASIRYWAATGLGNLASENETASSDLKAATNDRSPVVRVAAAYALLRLDNANKDALDVLAKEASSEHEWIRLHAVTAIDELGEAARPALDVLKAALKDTDNKYVVRVANHAVNELTGTNNDVR